MLAFIGGTGLTRLEGFEILNEKLVDTPYGQPSAAVLEVGHSEHPQRSAFFLARHGHPHGIAPHAVNYRANIWALKEMGATAVIGVNAVGSVDPSLHPTDLVLPDQLIDYTWGRASTFSTDSAVEHIDFSWPYTASLIEQIVSAAKSSGIQVRQGGVYAATQGPRLETAAEIRRLANDGCTLVGMTGMPEAALAREAGLEYASLCLVVNPAAGVKAEGAPDREITMADIEQAVLDGMSNVRQLIATLVGEQQQR
ncbi:S-methyl-5'-thioinosine phosphorylase [Allohahella marinimesophila]|uniref:Probable S-methyl-5'-thioinosine phosphorylase n=1 Tax=Allohahella marinimesophila TaxID=1054972 RepID=A0ABP7Q920_9GAMM